MGLTINTNVAALSTYSNLSKTENSLSKSLQRLSSGMRINTAADDAAGLTIATNIGSQVSGLTVAGQNIEDGTSIAETTDGALSTVQVILGRLRDLAVQAANGTNDANSRKSIQTEATQLQAEIQRMSTSVSFNGIKLLDGSADNTGVANPTTPNGKINLQVGANSGDTITLDLSGADLTKLFPTPGSTQNSDMGSYVLSDGTNNADYENAAQIPGTITLIDSMISKISTARSTIGAVENRLADAGSTITTAITNLTAAKSRITDVDMASEMANYTKQQVLAQAGTAMLSQANSMPQLALKLLNG